MKRALRLRDMVPVQTDCPDKKQGIAEPISIAELSIQHFGAPRGLPVLFAPTGLIEPR